MGTSNIEFGIYLAEARHKTGRSLADVAHLSTVSAHHLQALEQGRGDLLPAGIRRRVIVRSYACAVGLDPHATLEQFERIFGPSLEPLRIPGALDGTIRPTLWRRTITFPARSVRWVIRTIVDTTRWIVMLPVRACRWTFAFLMRLVRAVVAFVVLLALGAVRIPVRAVTWTFGGLARAMRATGLASRNASTALLRVCRNALTAFAGLLYRIAATAFLVLIYRIALPVLLVPARIARRAARVRAPSWRPAFRVSSSFVTIPAAIVLTAIATTHVVTRQGWASDTRQPEPPAPVAQPAVVKASLVEEPQPSGTALVTDRTPAPEPVAPLRTRAIEKKAPVVATRGKVATSRNTRSRATAVGTVRNSRTKPRLVVTSTPAGARVTVNGIAWGVTPVSIRYLPAGDKTIRVTKDGYVGAERRLLLGEESGTASVGVTLRRRR